MSTGSPATFWTASVVGWLASFAANRAEQVRPSKKLMEHVANVIKGKARVFLLDEQLVVYEKVLACGSARVGRSENGGGDREGRTRNWKVSELAINLMSGLAQPAGTMRST